MKQYFESVWFEQAAEYAKRSAKWHARGAGQMAEMLSYDIRLFFQREPYTWVEIEHVHNNVTYIADGFTFCDGVDEYNHEWGTDKAILRAKRKIAKRLVWERDCRKLLRGVQERLSAFRAEAYDLVREVHRAEQDHRDGATRRLE